MDVYEPGQRRKRKARERAMVRQSRRHTLSSITEQPLVRKLPSIPLPGSDSPLRRRAELIGRDLIWYVRHSVQVQLGLAGVVGVLFLLFVASHLLTGRIFPNVWALGVHLGDMTVEEAQAALQNAWQNRVRVRLVDGERAWQATPAQLGLQLDAAKIAEAARSVGLSGIPMGYGITPVVSVDFTTAQDFLLDMTAQTDIAPINAGYRWEGDQLVGVPGTDGRMMDVPQVMDKLLDAPATVVEAGRLDLIMSVLSPAVTDPAPYLDEALAIASQPFSLTGYDPFTNEMVAWSTDRDVFTSWLEAGEDGLTLRRETFAAFIDAQNQSLAATNNLRFLDPEETKDRMRDAIQQGANSVSLRIRYRPTTYTVVRGDTGFRIARKTGLPFFLIEKANEGRDWNALLSVDEVINLPSRDEVLPLPPLPHKRIVVNLNTQSLVAFENGQPVFSWLISSGLEDYPTYPGVYQILSHNEVAKGSSFTLCGSAGCGQWEMYWFMGIYEVQPGLMNGFHGAVLLPNGAYLGGGNVGAPYTYGCVMSQNDNAKLLYDWAEEGTIVEIISSEYAPQSDLGQLVYNQSFSSS